MKQFTRKIVREKMWPQRHIVIIFSFLLFSFLLSHFISCSKKPETIINELLRPAAQTQDNSSNGTPETNIEAGSINIGAGEKEEFINTFWSGMMKEANLPEPLQEKIIDQLIKGPDLVMELLTIFEGDPFLYFLVDKQHALDRNYVPPDLVELGNGSYSVTRNGLMLRQDAADSLESMAAAAKANNVTLTAASTYRSYDYQVDVYARNVNEMGQQEADRVSARPGHSQHQLGLVVDFYPIDDAFAETTASSWLKQNAARFGWSLSFPQGYEEVTGYSYESWHYRYVGRELASFIDNYFEGIQQYALQFILAWIESED